MLGVDYGQGFAIAAPAPVEGLLMQTAGGAPPGNFRSGSP
jgi:hypothetical protein